MFQGENPRKISPIDLNRSEITDIIVIFDVPSGC